MAPIIRIAVVQWHIKVALLYLTSPYTSMYDPDG